jgi:hypothetical protein
VSLVTLDMIQGVLGTIIRLHLRHSKLCGEGEGCYTMTMAVKGISIPSRRLLITIAIHSFNSCVELGL